MQKQQPKYGFIEGIALNEKTACGLKVANYTVKILHQRDCPKCNEFLKF